ncbi:MAG TPA: ribosome maturation factor RimM [Hyphomicrobiaceae bacterium]|nr:ribosome maturation factor RimM [Hyphomicrobiaceae bacterium]
MTEGGRRILLGQITGAHGIKGEVTIRAHTETPEGLMAYGALTASDGRSVTISQVRPTNKGIIARIAGVGDRTTAESLRGLDLFVDRARLPEPEDGAYYLEDLIGLTAVSQDGATIGTVRAVENYGAGDILVVTLVHGGDDVMVPFRDAFVPDVDIKGGRVTIVPPVMVGERDDEASYSEKGSEAEAQSKAQRRKRDDRDDGQ